MVITCHTAENEDQLSKHWVGSLTTKCVIIVLNRPKIFLSNIQVLDGIFKGSNQCCCCLYSDHMSCNTFGTGPVHICMHCVIVCSVIVCTKIIYSIHAVY